MFSQITKACYLIELKRSLLSQKLHEMKYIIQDNRHGTSLKVPIGWRGVLLPILTIYQQNISTTNIILIANFKLVQ